MLCPEATRPGDGSTGGGTGGGRAHGISYSYEWNAGGTFRAWVLVEPARQDGPPLRISYISYGLNGWLFQPPGDLDALRMRPPWERPRSSYTDTFSLRGRAGIPLLLDSMSDSGSPTDDTRPPDAQNEYARDSAMRSFCLNRHNGHVNGLFLDWSVRKVGLKELWTLKWHADFNTAGPWTKAGGVQPKD
jgi:prepilin-type processing-associated H-X9-DG protein